MALCHLSRIKNDLTQNPGLGWTPASWQRPASLPTVRAACRRVSSDAAGDRGIAPSHVLDRAATRAVGEPLSPDPTLVCSFFEDGQANVPVIHSSDALAVSSGFSDFVQQHTHTGVMSLFLRNTAVAASVSSRLCHCRLPVREPTSRKQGRREASFCLSTATYDVWRSQTVSASPQTLL